MKVTIEELRQTRIVNLCDFDKNEVTIKKEFINIANDITGKYIIKEPEILTGLLKYFTGSIGVYDLNKGIYLFGKFGVGKTVMFKIIQKLIAKLFPFNKNGFHITSIEQIIDHYKKENNLDKFGYREESKPLHLCINEFGKSINEKIYGTNADAIIHSLMMVRYELFQKGKLTHVTSNYNPAKLDVEPIIKDRLVEMFNVIEITGDSFRK